MALEKLNHSYKLASTVGDKTKMDTRDTLEQMTFEEKASLLTGAGSMSTRAAERTGDTVRVTLRLRNESEADGHEVVQIYAGCRNTGVRRPVKELKAFRRVFVRMWKFLSRGMPDTLWRVGEKT